MHYGRMGFNREAALCLEEGAKRTASCTALTDVEALVLAKDCFINMTTQQEDTCNLLASSGSKRINALKEQDKARQGVCPTPCL